MYVHILRVVQPSEVLEDIHHPKKKLCTLHLSTSNHPSSKQPLIDSVSMGLPVLENHVICALW